MAVLIEKPGLEGKPVKILGPEYEAGNLESGVSYKWKKNLPDRAAFVKYVQESERYWYMDNEQWFGSEKRRNPA